MTWTSSAVTRKHLHVQENQFILRINNKNNTEKENTNKINKEISSKENAMEEERKTITKWNNNIVETKINNKFDDDNEKDEKE